ncbi:TPA: hypothetical protein ACH3X1_006113 [Trebouxia sp. C0004]
MEGVHHLVDTDIDFHSDAGSPAGIDYVKAQQERNQEDLATAEQATDEARVAFLRRCLEELHRQLSNLCEKEKILLRRQASELLDFTTEELGS